MTENLRKLLIVDDEPGIRRQLKWAFDGVEVQLAENRKSAIATQAENPSSVVLLDLGLPPNQDGPSEGLAALQGILEKTPHVKVIVMTGQTERDYALKSIALGAYDFYAKPLDLDEVTLIVERAFRLYELEEENRRLLAEQGSTALPGLLTNSPAMKDVCSSVTRFARADVAVLIIGESGTGKELLARAVHNQSGRADGPFVAINCAAIPENLLESELFGYEKGAFTGAHRTTPGKIEQASHGTLFLDEIGDLPMALQAKLLRFLQERKVERVGGRREIDVDIRIVSATNKNVESMVAEQAFREDLYFRLGEAVVSVPPLRERPEDKVLIAQHFLETWLGEQGLPAMRFSANALAAISQFDWPGNVRELQNRVKRAAVSAEDSLIETADLGLDAKQAAEATLCTLKEARQRAEAQAINNALLHADGNVTKAAKLLGVSRPTLYQLMREHHQKIEPSKDDVAAN